MTFDHLPAPFVVDARAAMLKKHPALSKHARNLYMTMRALADGKTGELRWKNGQWIKATVFDRQAEMCRVVRLPAMRELIDAGLVSLNRPRIWRIIGGRRRAVMGESQYTVFRDPKPENDRKSNDSSKVCLQESVSRTVQETDRQIFPEAPSGTSMGFGGEGFERVREGSHAESSSSKAPTNDDDLRMRPRANEQTRVEKIITRVAAILKKRGDHPIFVAEALELIDQRSQDAGSVPTDAKYFLISYENLLESRDDLAALTDLIIRKRYLREKYMPAPIAPNEKDAEKIALVHQIVEEAARDGRRATEVLAERLGKHDTTE
jgi:hypothetical protein